MRDRRVGLLSLAVICASLHCSSGDSEPSTSGDSTAAPESTVPAEQRPETAPAEQPPATARVEQPPSAAPAEGAVDTRLPPGFHLDSYPGTYRPQNNRRSRGAGEEVELLLRSQPTGAAAAVNGQSVGTTPVLWRAPAPRKPVEFTFVLPGYAMARYRFVPTRSGIVHATLKKLPGEGGDGAPPAP